MVRLVFVCRAESDVHVVQSCEYKRFCCAYSCATVRCHYFKFVIFLRTLNNLFILVLHQHLNVYETAPHEIQCTVFSCSLSICCHQSIASVQQQMAEEEEQRVTLCPR